MEKEIDLLKSIKWKYDDSGRDLGTERREVSFDDAAWEVGYAPLAYGDEDITTVIEFSPIEKKNISPLISVPNSRCQKTGRWMPC